METTKVLHAYGQAIRGDWSDVDGKWVEADLDKIAEAYESEANNLPVYINELVKSIDVCLKCQTWLQHCKC